MLGGILGTFGSVLAKAGIIRGTAGKLLGGGGKAATPAAGRAISGPISNLPVFNPGSAIVRAGVGTAVAIPAGRAVAGVGRKYGKKILGMIAAGVLFESGGKLFNAFTGEEYKSPRRMNYANGKALSRAIRRFDGAAKQYAKVLKATKGTKKCGYTITPKRKGRKCA
jgi:hypothetical protein